MQGNAYDSYNANRNLGTVRLIRPRLLAGHGTTHEELREAEEVIFPDVRKTQVPRGSSGAIWTIRPGPNRRRRPDEQGGRSRQIVQGIAGGSTRNGQDAKA